MKNRANRAIWVAYVITMFFLLIVWWGGRAAERADREADCLAAEARQPEGFVSCEEANP